MLKRLIGTVLVLLSFFVGGCASLPFNIEAGYELSPATGKGVAVLSATADCQANLNLKLGAPGSVSREIIGLDQSRAVRPTPFMWTNPCGRVIMRELPAGRYVIDSFMLIGSIPGTTYAEPAVPLSFAFDVEAGKATYIGHLAFDIDFSRRAYRIFHEDRRGRDIGILKAHARNVSDAKVIYSSPSEPIRSEYKALRGTNVQIMIVR